jgi:hypothetical protein
MLFTRKSLRIKVMSEMRELIDAELDTVCGGHHGCHGHHGHHGHQGNQGNQGLFDFGNIGSFSFGNFSFGNIVNFGNIVIQPTIALQVGVAVGGDASVTQALSQLNFSSIELPHDSYSSMASGLPRHGYSPGYSSIGGLPRHA